MKLQKFDFDKSSYERPNRKWICGRKCEGCECKEGPKEISGLNLFTATCSQSENKCQPIRSIRGQRAILSFSVIAVTLIIVGYILAINNENDLFIIPGPPTSVHGTIPMLGKDCSTCHSMKDNNWINAAFAEHSSLADSTKCLECHRFNSLTKEESLALSKDEKSPKPLDLAGLLPHNVKDSDIFGKSSPKFQEEIACATCHKEHRGFKHDMKKMGDQRCQACHDQKFKSFKRDHPEFTLYPYRDENYVNFNHTLHFGEFSKQNRAELLGNFNCKSCHTDNPDNGLIIKPGTFEKVCYSCHQLPETNLTVLHLPSSKADLSSLYGAQLQGNKLAEEYLINKQKALDILNGQGIEEIARLTFTNKKNIETYIANLADNDFADALYLKEAKKIKHGKEAALQALVWTVADQIKQNIEIKKGSILKNTEATLNQLMSSPKIAKLLQLVDSLLSSANSSDSPDFHLPAWQNFFASVDQYLPRDKRTYLPTELSTTSNSPVVTYLRKKKKLSESTLNKLNNLLQKSKKSTIHKDIEKYLKTLKLYTKINLYYKKVIDKLSKNLAANPENASTIRNNFDSQLLSTLSTTILQDKGVVSALEKVLDSKTKKALKAAKGKGLEKVLVDYEIHLYLMTAYTLDQLKTPSDSKELPKISTPELLELKNHPNWQILTSEYGDKQLKIKKMTEHASPLLVKYYMKHNSPNFEKPTESPGSCMLCHSRISEEKISNWTSPPPVKKLTKFSHAPHSQDCGSCHIFKKDSDSGNSQLSLFSGYNKEFQPMSKNSCAECHSKRGAGDHCLDCHNYHSTDPDKFKADMLDILNSFK